MSILERFLLEEDRRLRDVEPVPPSLHNVDFDYVLLDVGAPDWRLVQWRRVGDITGGWAFVRGEENWTKAIAGPSGRMVGAVEHPLGRKYGRVNPVLLPRYAESCLLNEGGAASAGKPYEPGRFGIPVDLGRYVFALFGRNDREIYDADGEPFPFRVDVTRFFGEDPTEEALREQVSEGEDVKIHGQGYGRSSVVVTLRGEKAKQYFREATYTRDWEGFVANERNALRIATGIEVSGE